MLNITFFEINTEYYLIELSIKLFVFQHWVMSKDDNGANYFGFPPRSALNGRVWFNYNRVLKGFDLFS